MGDVKIDLNTLVKTGYLNKGDTLFFVCNPECTCTIAKGDSGEYKLKHGSQIFTVEELCEEWLGSDFDDDPHNWIRNDAGETLFDLWQVCKKGKVA